MKKVLFLLTLTFCFLNAQYIKEPIFNEASYVKTFGNPKNEAIVFVHGLGDEASDIWKTSVEALKKDYFIMIFDLPGFGKSDKSNQLYSPSKYANFINTLIDNFVDKPFHLVGHSMGASISLLYTSLYDSRVRSLTLIDAAAILEKNTYSQFVLKSKVKNSAVSGIVSSLPGMMNEILPFEVDALVNTKLTRKFILRSNPGTIAAMALAKEDFSSIPRKLKTPTLIIWGKEDKVAPLRTGQALDYLMPNSKLEVFENASHVPMKDDFNRYLSLLKKHLKVKYYKMAKEKNYKEKSTRVIKKEKNRRLSGYFKKLVIKDSKKIEIIDATIEELILINSKVKILNSKLTLERKSLIENSQVEITASKLDTRYALELENSKLNFAGVDIYSLNAPFKAKTENSQEDITYSLSEVNGRNTHGVFNINFE